mgnify:CR=1 FL=1
MLVLSLVACGDSTPNKDMLSEEYKEFQEWKDHKEKKELHREIRSIVEEIMWEMWSYGPPYYYYEDYNYGEPYYYEESNWNTNDYPYELDTDCSEGNVCWEEILDIFENIQPPSEYMPVEPEGGIGWQPRGPPR